MHRLPMKNWHLWLQAKYMVKKQLKLRQMAIEFMTVLSRRM